MYGGAAGGGKSEALLMAALQYVDVPGYSALLLRKTYSDLSLPGALMDRAQEWLSGTSARWNDTKKTWTFPSGATLTFGYLDSKLDHLRYQGAEFQFVGFDELTQFPESQYTYLHSRLRKKEGSFVPLRMRSATNPGGPGHDWVKKRFLTHPDGRAFIPAGVKDNHHLDKSYMDQLRKLDPITLKQLLEGDWDAVESGEIFKRGYFRYYRDDGEFYLLEQTHGDETHWLPIRKSSLSVFGTVDLALSVKKSADYTAIGIFGLDSSGNKLVLDVHRDRMEAPDIGPAIRRMSSRWDADYMIIEKVAFQESIIQQERRRGAAIKPYAPKGDKRSRALAASTRYAAHTVFHPEHAPWLSAFEAELLVFKGDDSTKDDQVDMISMAAIHASKLYGTPDVVLDDAETPEETSETVNELSQDDKIRQAIERRYIAPKETDEEPAIADTRWERWIMED